MLEHPFKVSAVVLVYVVERFIVSDKSAGPGAAAVGAFNVAQVVQNKAAHVFPLIAKAHKG